MNGVGIRLLLAQVGNSQQVLAGSSRENLTQLIITAVGPGWIYWQDDEDEWYGAYYPKDKSSLGGFGHLGITYREVWL